MTPQQVGAAVRVLRWLAAELARDRRLYVHEPAGVPLLAGVERAAHDEDVGHVLAYFVAHEGHHRGQIVMLARQLGHRLPVSTTSGLWQWTKFSREDRG